MEQAERPAIRRRYIAAAAGLFSRLVFSSALGFGPATALAASGTCPGPHPAFLGQSGSGDPAALSPSKPLRILAIGSSSTQGIGASGPKFAYPAQLQADLAVSLGAPVVVQNAGIGGETISTTLVRLKLLLKQTPPDLVVWQVGTNDAVEGVDEPRFRGFLDEGASAVRAANARLILIDPQFFPAIKDVARYEQVVAIIQDVGAKNRAPVFSRYAMMKKWGAESPDLLRDMLWKDGFHMSDRGYGCLAQDLAADMTSLWRRPVNIAEKPLPGAVIAK
jgi:acyl-CoA thioesterase I